MRVVVAVTVAMSAVAAIIGLRYGYAVATTTETDVINYYAQQYLEDRRAIGEQGALTDCRARPGTAPGIWLVVECGPVPHDGRGNYAYFVNRTGGLEHRVDPAASDTPTALIREPQT